MPYLKSFHYGWIVASATFLTLMTGAAVRSTPGILIAPLENEFHWSRTTISLAISINLLLYGLMGPFTAALMERFGIRRTIPIAFALIGTGVALTSLMRESWQMIVLWGVVVGIGTGAVANVLAAMIATRWFAVRRGFVLGLMSASVATGQLLFLPTLASITTNFGWRATVLTMAGVVFVVLPIVAFFMRDRPADVGLAPYGETGGPKPTLPMTGNPITHAFKVLGEAIYVRDFWLLAGTFFICGASTNGLIGTHLIAACLDNGISDVTGAGLLAAMGVFNLIGTTGSGWLSDRVDSRILLAVFYGLRGLSLIYLPYSFVSLYGLSVFTAFYGLDWFATVAPTVRLISNAFGREKTGIVYGWIFVAHQLGGASAAFFGGVMRENFGTYLESFVFSGLLCLVAAVLAMFIGRERKDGASALIPAA
jgi:sugar phosphate permease